MRGLFGRKVCVLGIGGTGAELARMCVALNMDVTAYRRRALPSPVAGVRTLSLDAGHHIGDALDGAEFLALCAALNDESHRMVGRDEIARMRPGSYIVNVARAQLVDMDAMADALRSGHLAGAGFDVFDPDEPLAPHHPAWSLPNMLITPHITPQMPDRTARTLEIIAENRRRYLDGEPLINQLTPRDAFTHRTPGSHRRMGRLARAYRRVARRLILR